jgi:pimeloyl-ACP methyl ester carboxylesterase
MSLNALMVYTIQHAVIMNHKDLLTIVLFFLFTHAHSATSFTRREFGSGASKAWLFIPDSVDVDRMVVFLHGYGASNPACYGGWINDMLSNGQVVLFPKFQWWLLYPSTSLYTKRVLKNIEEATAFLNASYKVNHDGIILIGHSIGGAVAGNVANHYGKTKEQQVDGLMLIQSGPPYLNLVHHNAFKNVSEETVLMAVTSRNDFIVGKWHGRMAYRKAKKIPENRKVWLHQVPSRRRFRIFDATHVEPINKHMAFDTGNRNLIIWGAFWLGSENYVDTNVYYRLTQYVIDVADDSLGVIDKHALDLVYSGEWKGKPLKPLRVKR